MGFDIPMLLLKNGLLHVKSVVSREALAEMLAAVKRLEEKFPYGFTHNDNYTSAVGVPKTESPKPTDYTATIIYPYVGFMEPVLLAPLAHPLIHEIVESVVGKDYYLSNVWMQSAPPRTGRMGFHKDPRGSVTFTFLLDSLGSRMGGTVLVPGSHINTPPPLFAMNDVNAPHPDEIEIRGDAGDIFFFATEAWHARAANESSQGTRRIFFNFSNRSSRNTVSWMNGPTPEQVEMAKAMLPERMHRMFQLDPELTANLQTDVLSPDEIRSGMNAHYQILADISHSRRTFGKSSFHPKYPGYTLPFTTRFTERRPFSMIKYLGYLKPIPLMKFAIRDVLLEKLRKLGKSAILPAPFFPFNSQVAPKK